MPLIHETKYVHFEIWVDGKKIGKLLTRHLTRYNPETKQYWVTFNQRSLPCTHNQHDQNIRCKLEFTTLAGAPIHELFAELSKRFTVSASPIIKSAVKPALTPLPSKE